MKDAFGVDREQVAKAMKPKQLVTVLRYSKAPANVGGSGSRMGAAAKARIAARQSAGQPAESLSRAFAGMGQAAKAPKPALSPSAGQDALARGMAGATAKPKGPLPGPKPKAPTQRVVGDLFAERGNQATMDASRAVRGRASRKRKLVAAGGTAGLAAAGGGTVLAVDHARGRKKGGRPSVSA